MSDFRLLSMRKSPFHNDDLINSDKDKRPTIRIPIGAYNRLNEYFKENNQDFSKGIRSLCYEKLDTICDERKTFNNLEVFMLIPKMKLPYPKDEDFDMEDYIRNFYHNLNTYSEIIAIVNTEIDFYDDFNHVRHFDDEYNLVYDMKEFKADKFPMHILQNTKETCVYRTHKGVLNSFHSFKDRQSVLYSNLNVDDCYFVRFPLNNYLDVYRDGQFQQATFSNSHEGVYVFSALNGAVKYYCTINWTYSRENNNIAFEYYFEDEGNFLDDVYNARDEHNNKDVRLINSALEIVSGDYRRKKLEDYVNNLLKEVEFVRELIKNDNEGFYDVD